MILTTAFKRWFGTSSVYKEDDGSTRITGKSFELTYGLSYNHYLKRKVGYGFSFYIDNSEKLSLVFRLYWFVLIAWGRHRKSLDWEARENAPSYGFNFVDNSELCLHLGAKTKYIPLPWHRTCVKRLVLSQQDEWVLVGESESTPMQFREKVVYVTKHNEHQNITATMTMTKNVFRFTWCKWLPLFEKKVRYADFKYSDGGIGHDRSGWKGGVIGGGVVMRRDEFTPLDTLRRLIEEQHYG